MPAPAFVQTAANTVSASSLASVTATYASANTAGNLLLAAVSWSDATSSVAPTIADTQANTWTTLSTVTSGTAQGTTIFYVPGCAAHVAGNIVTASFSPSRTFISIIIGEWTLDSSNLDGRSIGTGTLSTYTGVSASARSTNALLFAFGRWDSGAKWNVLPSGWNSRSVALPNATVFADNLGPSTGTYNFNPTTTGGTSTNPYTIEVLVFEVAPPAPSGGGDSLLLWA